MKLSLSGRLVETAEGTIVSVGEFVELAARCGYDAVDLRFSQLPPDAPEAVWGALRAALSASGLAVFQAAWAGGLEAPDAERTFSGFAGRLAGLGAEGVRMSGDAPTLKLAARLAAPHGLRVHYQMHTDGPFETVAAALRTVEEIGEPNFAVVPEPANLMMAREAFGADMLAPLAGHIGGAHVQTVEVRPDAPDALRLADGTEVRYARVPYDENRQIDFATFFAALRRAGFDGFVNELEPCPGLDALEDTVRRAAEFLRPLIA